uniref:Uncharacterized protein n=1 Tax=Cacopsylla melanoneura TaxID=428564 RepID=A0A8D9AKJ2_9HEMI
MSNKKSNSGNPAIMYLDNSKSDDSKTIVNLFARNFSQNYSSDFCPKKALDYNTHINICKIEIKERDTFQLMVKLPNHACKGPDEISPLLFKSCAGALAAPLTLIFQRSLDTGVFPQRWKTSYITPIFKSSGDKSDIKSYRPVSISSIIPKLFFL